MTAPLMTLSDLADGAGRLQLDTDGDPVDLFRLVDLDATPQHDAAEAAALEAMSGPTPILVGVTSRSPSSVPTRLLEAMTCTVTSSGDAGCAPQRQVVEVDDVDDALADLESAIGASPIAALTLNGLLQLTSRLPVSDGLVAESLAYSTLLAGREFAAWRSGTARRPVPDVADPVLVSRTDDVLHVTLNQPERRNAFGRATRDGLIEAFTLAELDHTIRRIELSGRGPSFCSGGDLDEFGTADDVSSAHLLRVGQSAGRAIHRSASRVRVVVHGACIGAGVEVPAFAGRVEARKDAYFQLPELRMGLVPGAGGTVSITRRIGRWRTAFLALSGRPVATDVALRWGLVDGHA
ncbi:enoyl-CoA hydratase/isomerase family protein [Aeromicrobium yanjiei]|uniref:enoyl-CoA hydratase/isomerase family protein n=1 Tax=Aeromicrobium yanjiei TaxID=2662028 RepID=UPI002E253A1A